MMGKTHDVYNKIYNESQDPSADKSELFKVITPENIDEPDQYGQTLLHFASARSHQDVVDFLLDHKAQVNRSDMTMMTPLKCAIESVSDETFDVQNYIVQQLITHGAKIDEPDAITLYTALHMAVLEGNLLKTQLLLQNDANPIALSTSGETPIHLAVKSNHAIKLEILDLLFESYLKGGEVDPALIQLRDDTQLKWKMQERDKTSLRQLISSQSDNQFTLRDEEQNETQLTPPNNPNYKP